MSKKTQTRKYQIFVSSTHDDLIDERKEVTEAILRCDCIPAGMELWPASSLAQWEIIKSVIDDSDYYLLIIAGKYGSEGTDEKGNAVSYTEMEFNYAVNTGKPIIALVHKNPAQLPGAKIEMDARKRKKLDRFKKKVMKDRLVSFWTSIEDVKSETILAIQNAIKKYPTEGWAKNSGILNRCQEVHYFNVESMSYLDYIVDSLTDNTVVIFNLKSLTDEEKQRVRDFVRGYRYESLGDTGEISSLLICTPMDVKIRHLTLDQYEIGNGRYIKMLGEIL